MPKELARILATFGYVGYAPVASGTVASAVGMLLCIWLQPNMTVYIVTAVVLTVVGIYASGVMEKELNEKDPSCVVIDEVAGMMVAFFMLPATWPVIWTAFFLFRALDMFKIWPCNKLEDAGGGWGIMADDLVAGVYTNIVMQLAICLTGLV